MAKLPRPGVTWPKGEICQSFGGTWPTEDPFFKFFLGNFVGWSEMDFNFYMLNSPGGFYFLALKKQHRFSVSSLQSLASLADDSPPPTPQPASVLVLYSQRSQRK